MAAQPSSPTSSHRHIKRSDSPTVAEVKEEWQKVLANKPKLQDSNLEEAMKSYHRFNVIFLGEMGSGKSTIINKIVGKNLLPTSARPFACSAIPCEVFNAGDNCDSIKITVEFLDKYKIYSSYIGLIA